MSVSQAEIQEMRKLALFSKRLSGWHVKNLNAWPQIAFQSFEKAEIDYAIGDRPDESYVNYLIKFKGGKKPKDFVKRCQALEQWVKTLLWTDINFSVRDHQNNVLFPEPKKEKK